jgi:putative oxidoreductase
MRSKTSIVSWILQAFLALFFAAASGAPKLLLPVEQLPMPIVLPELFVRAIGVCEWLGALGLILPGVTRVRPSVTVAAAIGLVALTLCATIYQLLASQPANAVFALIMCALCATVAYGRARVAPLRERKAVVLQAA